MHACGGGLRLRSGYSGLVVYTTNQRAAQRTTSGDMDARISGNGGFNVGHIDASMFNVGPLKCCQSVTHAGHRDVETLRRKKKKNPAHQQHAHRPRTMDRDEKGLALADRLGKRRSGIRTKASIVTPDLITDVTGNYDTYM